MPIVIDILLNKVHQLQTFRELLEERALHRPHDLAYAFLVGTTPTNQWSYAELNRQAARVGRQLKALDAGGARALLVYPPGGDFLSSFLACLCRNVVAIPVPAPEAWNLRRSIPRLRAIAEDAQARIVLTTRKTEALWAGADNLSWDFKKIPWVTTDNCIDQSSHDLGDELIDPDLPAYLQYTSGSTSAPSGVAVSHRNLMHHLKVLHYTCGYGRGATVTWMPHFHDYGLVQGLLQPLYSGDPCYFMSPLSFLKRPSNWLAAITNYRATHSQGPNFAYSHCLRRIRDDELSALDLTSWNSAGNAAEPINPQVIDDFAGRFKAAGFRRESFAPAYGLAEATLLVSSTQGCSGPEILELDADALWRGQVTVSSRPAGNTRRLVSCGQLVRETRVSIVHPETRAKCSENEVGEIWVSSKSVAAGYWNDQPRTTAIFGAHLIDGSGPWLRTGDLGFLRDGHLFVCGRLKDLIIIRGSNYAPQDIEWAAQRSHPLVEFGEGAAFSLTVDDEERLAIFQELNGKEFPPGISPIDVAVNIRESIALEFEIRAYAVILAKRGTTPKTSSGKIQRGTCRMGLLNGSLARLFILSEGPLPKVDNNAPV
ncbi:fatty acyl-AMP ligase [Bradyrhizobium sp. GCM10023182]|uniref:Fatty acyl-AMP ligase n=1 Tax=Bradyrhizobium zhengyangense TaxID=2911009 RepID=A0ABS9M297_9BRAD|nr:fatty acyl-AMP ligase [Bradyrhizobium zhengyangense]MCG2673396.1 fatty acyl-AMP ligase [Bradyrhizobium zhengyangense]